MALPPLVFLLLRLAILATSADRLGHLAEGEVAHANLAWDLKEGCARSDIWSYQVVPFHGGTMVSALLFVPWSMVFGDEYASLKGLALAYALTAMVLWMWVLYRVSGAGASMVFGWLYALAPPVLVRMQLTLWGTHPELNACLAASTALACAALTGRPSLKRRWLFLFGVSAGFAVYFNLSAVLYETLLMIAVLASRYRPWLEPRGTRTTPVLRATDGASRHRSHSTTGPGRPGRRAVSPWLLTLAGVATGLVPMAWSMVAAGGTLLVYGEGPLGLVHGAATRLELLPRLLATVPPLSPQIPPAPPWTIEPVRAALAAVLLGTCLALAAGARWTKPPAAPLSRAAGLYPFLFLPVFAAVHLPFTTSTATTFGYCPRYVATLYPVLYAALALGTARRMQDRTSG